MKKIKNILITLIACIAFTSSINAASGSITASTGTKVASVGSTFKVTVKVSCPEGLGTWQFGLSYDSANISLVSGDTNVVGFTNQKGTEKSRSYTYTFKAIKSGSAGIRITGASMASYTEDTTIFTPAISGTSVTVKTQAEIQASYSKDNNLKSLSVDGYEITPVFDKNTTDYTVSVPDTVTSIKVQAAVNDRTARVTGTGDIDISEGINKVEIVVTAQNGSTKTYNLTIDVKDLNPITVTSNGVDYTVVKKADLLTEPIGHTPTTIMIGESEVPAFKSELTNFTIVGLKDPNGKISMFIYDESNNKYTPYIELKSTAITLYPKDLPEILEGFTKTTIDINEIPCDVLVSDIDKNLYVLYALNIETGEEEYFIYDKKTNGFVTYTKDIFDKYITETKELKLYLTAASGVAGILLLISICLAIKKAKLKRLLKKFSRIQENPIEVIDEEISGQVEVPESEVLVEEIHTEQNNSNKSKKKKRH